MHNELRQTVQHRQKDFGGNCSQPCHDRPKNSVSFWVWTGPKEDTLSMMEQTKPEGKNTNQSHVVSKWLVWGSQLLDNISQTLFFPRHECHTGNLVQGLKGMKSLRQQPAANRTFNKRSRSVLSDHAVMNRLRRLLSKSQRACANTQRAVHQSRIQSEGALSLPDAVRLSLGA